MKSFFSLPQFRTLSVNLLQQIILESEVSSFSQLIQIQLQTIPKLAAPVHVHEFHTPVLKWCPWWHKHDAQMCHLS